MSNTETKPVVIWEACYNCNADRQSWSAISRARAHEMVKGLPLLESVTGSRIWGKDDTQVHAQVYFVDADEIGEYEDAYDYDSAADYAAYEGY